MREFWNIWDRWTRMLVLLLLGIAVIVSIFSMAGTPLSLQMIGTAVAIISAIAVLEHRSREGRQLMISLLIAQRNNKELQQITQRVNDLRRKDTPLTAYLDPNSQEYKDIIHVLNHHEFIAVGIRLHCFDENVYKQLVCGAVVRLWTDCEDFVAKIRQNRNSSTPYQDIERLARRWIINPIKPVA